MAIGMLLLSVSLTISSRLINVTHICKATNVVTAIIVFEDNQSVALISGKKIQSVAGSMTDCIWSIQNYLQDSHTVQSSKRKCALCNSSICPKGVWEAWKSWGCHYIHSLGFPKTSQTWEDRFGDWLCNPLSGIKICTKSFAASCKMKTSPFEASSHWPSVNKWSLTFDPHSRRLCVTMWLWVAASDSDSLQLSAPWDALRGRFSSWNQPSCRPGPWGCYLKGDRWCSAQNELVGNQNNRSVMLGSWQWTQLARFWFNLGRSRKNNVRVQRQPRIGHGWLALAHLPKHV